MASSSEGRRGQIVGASCVTAALAALAIVSATSAPGPVGGTAAGAPRDREGGASADAAAAPRRVRLPGVPSGEAGAASAELAGAPQDEEWEGFLRNNPFFPRALLKCGATLPTPERLFRHRRLNPRDVYIPPKDRTDFRRCFEARLDELGRERGVFLEAASEDMQRRVADGREEPARLRTDPEGRQLIERNGGIRPGAVITDRLVYQNGDSIDRLYCVGDTPYAIRCADRPGYAELHLRATQLAVEITQWFVRQGCLSPGEAFPILEEIE